MTNLLESNMIFNKINKVKYKVEKINLTEQVIELPCKNYTEGLAGLKKKLEDIQQTFSDETCDIYANYNSDVFKVECLHALATDSPK